MTANKPETVLYIVPTFCILASHGGISYTQDRLGSNTYSVAQEREIEGMLC